MPVTFTLLAIFRIMISAHAYPTFELSNACSCWQKLLLESESWGSVRKSPTVQNPLRYLTLPSNFQRCAAVGKKLLLESESWGSVRKSPTVRKPPSLPYIGILFDWYLVRGYVPCGACRSPRPSDDQTMCCIRGCDLPHPPLRLQKTLAIDLYI